MGAWRLLSVVCFAAVLLPGCMGQMRPSDLLSHMPPPGSLSVAHYFPDHPTKQFPAGEEIKVVVSAHNEGSKPYNITAMMGSLNSPVDFDLYVQNFTQQVYFRLLPAAEELSVEYSFRPDPNLSPREFTVALHLIYEDPETGRMHSNLVFNSTVDIVEMQKLIDTEMLFLYLMLLGVVGLGGYYAYLNMADKLGLNKSSKKKTKSTGPKLIDHDEWIKGTTYEVNKRRKATQRNTGGKAVTAS